LKLLSRRSVRCHEKILLQLGYQIKKQRRGGLPHRGSKNSMAADVEDSVYICKAVC
jgi:hypothetical protein